MENARTFTTRLADLLAREHAALGEFLVELADLDRKRLWLDLGYASLFDFLHRELGLSKASASFRKKAAELIQSFPEVLEPIRDGRLCLSSVFEVAKVLTQGNRHEVLPRFFQLSKREAKAVAAALRPDDAPPQRSVVTTVRVPAAPSSTPAPVTLAGAPTAAALGGDSFSLRVVCPAKLPDATGAAAPESHPARPTPPPPVADPLTAELNRLHVTVSARFLKKLDAARDALSHSHPNAGMEEILEAGLDLLLEKAAKRNGLVQKPRASPPPSSDPEHVPAHVRRAVWKRDGGRCQFRLASGEICGSTRRVEIDHHPVPRALGGPSTVENCRLACDVHNDRAAREVFGDAWMDRFTRNPRAGSSRPTASRGDPAAGLLPSIPLPPA
jgi:hypothetical protein